MKTQTQAAKLGFVAIASVTLLAQTATAQQWTTNNLPSGLIAWWAAEGNLLDSAGGHDGSGSATPSYAPGRFGQAFQFNGTDQSVSVPDVHADLDSWTQFTLEAWFNADNVADAPTPGPGRAIFSKVGNVSDHSNFNQGYQLGWDANGTRLILQFNTNGQAWPGLATRAILPAPLLTNTWYHLVGTYDHNAVKIFLNGGPLTTNVVGPATLQNSSSSLRISKDDNLNVPFAGRIDDARIYNRALTESEIVYLYSGRPQLTIAPVAGNLVVVSWPLAANEWVLERTNVLGVTSTAWPQFPPPYQTNGVTLSVTITNTPATGNQFFRLHTP